MKIGLSSCGKPLNEETMIAYAEAGIEAMEVSIGRERVLEGVDLSEVARAAAKHGIELWSYHLPFPEYNLATRWEELRQKFVRRQTEHIHMAADMGITRYVVHPSVEPIPDELRSIRMEQSKKSLAELTEAANSVGGILCVENLPRTCLGRNSDEMLELLTAHPDLRICFDTNHLLSEDPIHFIERVGDKIETLHVSDYNFIDECHWLCGEGDADWKAIYDALCRVGYNGAWLYELGFGNTKKIERERNLTCADFARNARDIFAGQAPTVVPYKRLF